MLVSFAFYATENLAGYRATMPCGRLMVDSGAYSALTIGKRIGLDDYAEFLETWKGSWDTAVTLDVIGDPVATAANTRKLHARGIPVMPVFTRGASSTEFDAMVRDVGYVCVGGGVGMPPPVVIERLAALQRRALELGGGIHALGVGNLRGIRQIRPFSCDSSTVSNAFVWGKVVCYDGRRVHVIAVKDRATIRKYQILFRDAGLDLVELIRSGRQPKGLQRKPLMRGLSMAFVCADEDVAGQRVPVPAGVDDFPGTHLYSAVTGGHLAPAVAELDAILHSPSPQVPPVWERYRKLHRDQCRALDRVAA